MFQGQNIVMMGGSDDDDSGDGGDFMVRGGYGFGMGGTKKKKQMKNFPWGDKGEIEYPVTVDKWTNDNYCSNVYSSRFKRGPMLPLLYRDVSGLQKLEWHIITDPDGNKCVEKGAYNKETGELVLGIRVGYTEKYPEQTEEEIKENKEKGEPTRENFCFCGEFKNGKLNGLGRKYTSEWWYEEGKFQDGELVENELWMYFECDGGQSYYGIHKNKDEDQLRFYQDSMRYSKPERMEFWQYKENEKNGLYWDAYHQDQGKSRNRYYYEKNNRKEQDEALNPKQQECDAYLKEYLEANPKMKEFSEQDQDIREFMGMSRDPLDYIPDKTIQGKWKIHKKILVGKEYIVTNAQSDDQTEYFCMVFKSQMEQKSVLRLYERYKGSEEFKNNLKGKFDTNVNAIYDEGSVDIQGIETKKQFYIVVSQPKRTLDDILKEYDNKLDILTKINIFIQLTRQLQKIFKLGFYLLNIHPKNIELNEAGDQLYFTKFHNCESNYSKGYKYYPSIQHDTKDILVPMDTFVKIMSGNIQESWYKTYNNRPENNIQQSDEFLSFFYIIAQVFQGKLPWQECKDVDAMQEIKQQSPLTEFFDKDTDDDFFLIADYLFNLGSSRPDFERVVDELKVIKDKFALPRDDNKFIWLYKKEDEVLMASESDEDEINDRMVQVHKSKYSRSQVSIEQVVEINREEVYRINRPRENFTMEDSIYKIMLGQHKQFHAEHYKLVQEHDKKHNEYWGMPKRNPQTEIDLKTNNPFEKALDKKLSDTNWKKMIDDIEEQIFDQIRISQPFDLNVGQYNDPSCLQKVTLKDLMKDSQYHLYGLLQLVKLSKDKKKNTTCYRCTSILKDYKYAWLNDFNALCTECHQDEKQLMKLLQEMNHDPYCMPHFQSMDYARNDSILNQFGGSFQYKSKSHNYSYTCVQQMDWQLNLNRGKKVIQYVEDDVNKYWAKVISQPNCQLHPKYNNVALTIVDKGPQERWHKNENSERYIKISYQDNSTEQLAMLKDKREKKKKVELEGEQKKAEKQKGEEKKEENEEEANIEEEDNTPEVEEDSDEESNVSEMYTTVQNFMEYKEHSQILGIHLKRPCLYYSEEEGKLFVQKNFFQNEVAGDIRLLPMFESENKQFKKRFIVPVSNVYKEEETNQFKQIFAVCFSYERIVMQVFEVFVYWGDKGDHSQFELINSKVFIGLHVKNVYSNITEDGSIDGFRIQAKTQEEKKFRWMSFKRTKPYEFGFKTNVSYNRYGKYYEKSDSGSPKLYVLESQLTDEVVKDQDNISQFVFIMNNLRLLTNMVPDKIKKITLNTQNWLQPLEILSGRSLSQYFIGSKIVSQKIDQFTLKASKSETLFEQIRRDLSFSEHPTFTKIFDDEFNLQSFEMNFDFSYRNAIHDCLDFDNPTLVVDYRQTLLTYLDEIFFDSNSAQQIMTGLFGLSLEMENPIEEFNQFINDVGEEKRQRMFTELQDDSLPVTSNDDFYLYRMNTIACVNYDNDLFSKKALAILPEGVKQGSIQVNHFITDWTLSFVQTKLQRYLDKHDKQIRGADAKQDRQIAFEFFEKEGFMCDYDIAIFTKRINELYGGDIEQQKCYKLFIDSQFKSTSRIIINLFTSYFIFFVCAFMVQMFSESRQVIIYCNLSCLIMQVILVVIESMQFQYKGLIDYFRDIWNYFDIMHFVIYMVYFFMRVLIFDIGFILPTQDPNDDPLPLQEREALVKWVVVHSIIIFLIAFKLMFFMRVNENFSNLVQLVSNVFSQIGPFTVFLVMWMSVNSLLYNISGIEIVKFKDKPVMDFQGNKVIVSEDYEHVDASIALLLQNFRNSVGDITVPTYDYWVGDTNWGRKMTEYQTFMVGWAWILFLFNEFFILIVLLNFLIAIIGQSYDEVMSKAEIDRYQSRCDLNIEVAILTDTYNNLIGNIQTESKRVFYLMANTYHKDDDNEFQGFVKTIKSAIKKQNKILKDDIKRCFPNADLLSNFADKFSSISNLDYTVESKLNDVKREINSRMNDLGEKNSDLQNQMGEIKTQMNEIKNLLNSGLPEEAQE